MLSQYFDITETEYQKFISLARIQTFKKNDHILCTYKPMNKIYFLETGTIRGYRIQNDIDYTHYLFFENWFATDYESFLTGNASELNFEILKTAKVYEFNKNDLYSFYKDNPKFEKLRFIIAEYAYLKMVERIKHFQTKSLKDRYENLIKTNPSLFKDIPQYYLASYLGVAPQSLSRIKNS